MDDRTENCGSKLAEMTRFTGQEHRAVCHINQCVPMRKSDLN